MKRIFLTAITTLAMSPLSSAFAATQAAAPIPEGTYRKLTETATNGRPVSIQQDNLAWILTFANGQGTASLTTRQARCQISFVYRYERGPSRYSLFMVRENGDLTSDSHPSCPTMPDFAPRTEYRTVVATAGRRGSGDIRITPYTAHRNNLGGIWGPIR